MPKTWQQKFDTGRPPKVETVEKSGMGIPAGAKMLIADPPTVQKFVERIPKGKSMTIPELRAAMASEHNADTTCPLTTGIFLRIVAERALEQLSAGRKITDVAPFWRAIDPKSGVGKKLSCGTDRLVELRTADGITG